MKTHDNVIRLSKNARGMWTLDPFTWCPHWTYEDKRWCYWVCYAKKLDTMWWYNFSTLVYRDFINELHIKKIWKKLEKVPFIRLWTMCDPSADWEHTISIVKKIKPYVKNIVIVTKHWNILTEEQKKELEWVCVNTSISALDSLIQINHRMKQYTELKKYCSSVLRVNTCDFIDERLKKIQDWLLNNDKVINNILRIPKNHTLVLEWKIRVKKCNFLNKPVSASMHDDNVYFWNCIDCPDQCWITL